MNNEPVIVLYKHAQCGHCIRLNDMWDEIKAHIRLSYPAIRFAEVTGTGKDGNFDTNKYPIKLNQYNRWYPMILLVPGRIWNEAMKQLGPKNPVDIVEGVKIMNGFRHDTNGIQPLPVPKYHIFDKTKYIDWIKEVYNDPEFKAVQNRIDKAPNVQNHNNLLVRTVPQESKEVQESKEYTNNPLVTLRKNTKNNQAIYGDVCSIRIISRKK